MACSNLCLGASVDNGQSRAHEALWDDLAMQLVDFLILQTFSIPFYFLFSFSLFALVSFYSREALSS